MEALLRKACLWWVYLAGVLLLLLVLVTVINISAFGLDKIARMYGSNVAALPGYEDFVRLIIGCIALMFFPWAQAERGHIAVDFFANNFSSAWQKNLDILWLSLTLILVIFLGLLMFLGLLESRDDGALSSILGWIEWPFYIPGVLSLILWALVLAFQIFINKGEKLND